MRYHLSGVITKRQEITNVGKDVEERGPFIEWNVNWCSHYGKQYGGSSKIKNRATILPFDLPYDPGIPLLGIYLKEMKSQS